MDQSKNQMPISFYIFTSFIILICVYLGTMMLLSKPIARYKAKNPINISDGCLYYMGTNFKGLHMGRINNEYIAPIYNMSLTEFSKPAKGKNQLPYYDFSKSDRCYKIRYIIVDFNIFTNSNFFKQYYIYEYVD